MNRLLIIFFIILYSVPAIGVSIQLHYCGGKLASYSFGFQTEKKCSCGKGSEKKSCCKDTTLSFRLADDQLHSQSPDLPQSYSICTDNHLEVESDFFAQPTLLFPQEYRKPPDLKRPQLYLLNRSIRL